MRFLPSWARRHLVSGSKEPTADAPAVFDECRDWRQADVFHGAQPFVFDAAWKPRPLMDVDGVAVISQSCDACLPHRPRVQVAPVVRLTDKSDLAEARRGKRTNLVALPSLGDDCFADLDGLTTVAKAALLGLERVSGVSSDAEIREFSFGVARRFGRFAYPDKVVECLAPVRDTILERAHKPQSPLGQAVAFVHSFRVQCEDWTRTPHELTLLVVMEAGVLPTELDNLARPDDLDSRIRPDRAKTTKDRINACLTYLQRSDLDDARRYFTWQALADLWAQQCEEKTRALAYESVVGSVIAEVVSLDEFPMSRFLVTESLDLDHLSESRKPTL